MKCDLNLYIARSNLWDAKRSGTTTLMLQHTMEIRHSSTFMFDSRSAWNVQYTRRSNLCGMQNTMELRHSCLIVATHETSCTSRGATYGMQHTMKIRHSCFIVATHETSFTSLGATSGMQDTMELRHSCLIVAAHEKSFTLRGATFAKRNGNTTFMFDSRNTHKSHPLTSPNTALATKSSIQNMRFFLKTAEA